MDTYVIMDYKEKYMEALERAKTLYENANGMILKKWVEQVFPELKESEDDGIRKCICLCLEECVHNDIIRDYEKDKCLAWLEKQGEQKPAWSEEDEKRVHRISDFIWKNRKCDTDEIYQQEQDVNWLKSLRLQNRWKPSDEQMTALRRMKAAIAGEGEIYKPLNSLYEDLKKLREE